MGANDDPNFGHVRDRGRSDPDSADSDSGTDTSANAAAADTNADAGTRHGNMGAFRRFDKRDRFGCNEFRRFVRRSVPRPIFRSATAFKFRTRRSASVRQLYGW